MLQNIQGDDAVKTLHRYLIVVLPILFFANQARGQWAQTSGPYGGTVQCITATGAVLLAGTSGGGVFVSANNGASWDPDNSGLANLNVHSIVVNGATMFAGTGCGVYLSTNGGGSWFPSDTSSLDISVPCLAVVGQNILAATSTGIFRSTDNGKNWASSGLPNVVVTTFAVDGGNVYAGTYGGGVFLSTNGGSSWIPKSSGLSDLNVLSIAVNGTTLFAGTDYQGGVFISTHSGTTWMPASMNLPSMDIEALGVVGSDLFAGTHYYGSTGGGIFMSTDNGSSWSQANSGIPFPFINCFAAAASGLFAGTDGGGVYRSTDDGVNWVEVSNGLAGTSVRSLFATGTTIYAGSDYEGVSASNDNGRTWSQADSVIAGYYVYSLLPIGSNLIAGTNGGVFLSTDGGKSFSQSGIGGNVVNALAMNISETDIFAGTSTGVFRSTDRGASWVPLNSGLPTDYNTGYPLQVLCLAVSGTHLFAGTQGDGVYVSDDNGGSWAKTAMAGYYEGGGYMVVSGFATMGTSLVAALFQSYSSVAFTSDNFGTWKGSGWSQYPTISFTALAVSGTDIFAATPSGIFLSTDSTATWTEVDSGLSNRNVLSLAVEGSYLIAGTYGGGVWRRPLSEMVTAVEAASANIPRKFHLRQNYPNPFNPSTVINYQLAADELVTLNVYDILGRKIETLVNKRERAGNYSVKFNGSTLQSGVYFYRLQAGAYSATKKLMLLK